MAYTLNGFGVAVTTIAAISIRQAVTPNRMLGRINASYRFVSYGAIAGGLCGQLLGLRLGLLAGALGLVFSAVVIGLSPLRSLRSLDAVTAPTACMLPCRRSAPRPT